MIRVELYPDVLRRYPFDLQPREPDRTAGALSRWRSLDRLSEKKRGRDVVEPVLLSEAMTTLPLDEGRRQAK